MVANAVVRARVDCQLKEEATTVLAATGLTVSDAIRLLMIRIAHDRALPFHPWKPDESSISDKKVQRAKHKAAAGNMSRKEHSHLSERPK